MIRTARQGGHRPRSRIRPAPFRLRAVVPLLVTLATFAAPAHGEGPGLVLNGTSIHLEGDGWNEKNWGLGFQYDFAPRQNWVPFLTAGGFSDSDSEPLYYAGGGAKHRWHLTQGSYALHADLGATMFVMVRKHYNGGRPFVGALPMATIGTDRLELNAIYVPKVDPTLVPLLFFQVVVKF